LSRSLLLITDKSYWTWWEETRMASVYDVNRELEHNRIQCWQWALL